jgi:hypothetical protein
MEPAAFPERQSGRRAVAVGLRLTVHGYIIGLNVKHVNWKMTNNLA